MLKAFVLAAVGACLTGFGFGPPTGMLQPVLLHLILTSTRMIQKAQGSGMREQGYR
jgi:hypothetical protein